MLFAETKIKILLTGIFLLIFIRSGYPQFQLADTVAPASTKYKRGFILKVFMGSHYRKVWATPVPVLKFNKDTLKGGLTYIKSGGDLQSVNLKFIDSSNRHYTFKVIDKDQSKFLSPFWRKTIAGAITNDLTSALLPYAPLVVDKLISSSSSKPKLIGLYLLPGDSSYDHSLKNIKGRTGFLYQSYKDKEIEVLSTEDFLESRFKHRLPVDTILFLKQRFVDFLIGDFDRHRDQWEWKIKNINQEESAEPVSKDHDMAFSKFRDGLLPFLITRAQPIMQQYNSNYKLKSLAKTGHYLDHLLLPGLKEQDFIFTAKVLQEELTDSELESAVKSLPDTIHQLVGKKLVSNLKERRNSLSKLAIEYYKLLNKNVTLAGTDDLEKVVINFPSENETTITIKTNDTTILQQTFTFPTTKKISIYCLGGKDKIVINGTKANKLRINLYGGLQEDHYIQKENLKMNNVHIYDTKKGNKYSVHKKIKKHLTRNSTKHVFEREGF